MPQIARVQSLVVIDRVNALSLPFQWSNPKRVLQVCLVAYPLSLIVLFVAVGVVTSHFV